MNGKIADRSDRVTDEVWEDVNEFNKFIVEDFLDNQTHLSERSIVAYRSALHIFFVWVKDNLMNKKCTDIKKKEFLRYINWLVKRGFSESGIKFKKASVSSLNRFIENFYEDEYPNFRNFVSSDIQIPKTGNVFKKELMTPEDIQKICEDLERREEWCKLAYFLFSYSSGCRRAEARQLLKEVVDYEPIKKMVEVTDENGNTEMKESVSYRTHDIRCKGRSNLGKVRKLQFGEDVMRVFKKWLEVRGEDDCPYMFVTKQKNGIANQVGEGCFNDWYTDDFSKIVGYRITPHSSRRARASNLVIYDHRSLETAQKLLGHESTETTQIYVLRDDEDDADAAFV